MSKLTLPEGFVAGRPNCGVVQVAICAKVPYGPVHDFIAGLKGNPPNWKGWTYAHERELALNHFGTPWKRLALTGRHGLNWYIKRGWFDPAKTYAVNVTRHSVTIRDGEVIDQWRKGPLSTYPRLCRKMVNSIYEIG